MRTTLQLIGLCLAVAGSFSISAVGGMEARAQKLPICSRNNSLAAGNVPLLIQSMQPVAMAVSERSRHLFVINRGNENLNGPLVCHSSMATLDAATGRFIRGSAIGEIPTALAVDDVDGLVFTLSATNDQKRIANGGTIRVFDLNGKEAHKPFHFTIQTTDFYGMSVSGKTHRLFIATHNQIISLDARKLNGVRIVDLAGIGPGSIGVGPLAIDGKSGRLYVPMEEGVGIVSLSTGKVVRTIPFPAAERSLGVDSRAGRLYVASGTDCHAGGTGSLTILDTGSTKSVGTAEMSCTIAGPVTVDAPLGVVSVPSPGQTGSVIFDSKTGKKVRTLKSLSLVGAAIDPSAGIAYVATQHCTGRPVHCADSIVAVNPRSGVIVRTTPVAHAYQGVLIVASKQHRVYAASPYYDTITVIPTA
jgi:hypothetical protein